MANTIKIKRNGTSSQAPTSLEYGELAINYADGKIFYKNSSNQIKAFEGIAGSANYVIYRNSSGVLTGSSGLQYDGSDLTVNGFITSNYSSGPEGGELHLAAASTDTTLTGPIKIDIYGNRLRFFEGGGSNRGAYLDLTATGTGVATNLLGTSGAMNYAQTTGTKQSAISTAGTTIVSVSITTSGYPVQVMVTGDVENNSAGGWTVLQLYRGSTAIGNPVHTEGSAASENVPYALTAIDTPEAGTYTYALKLNNSAGGTFNFGESNGPVITVIELAGKTGATGAAGAAGTNGTNGQGVPTGGTTGQVLSKIDGTDYNTQWTTIAGSFTINGTSISLGGSGTVTAAAGTLTGTTLNSTVVNSSLTSVGTLSNLTVSGNVTASQYYGRARDTEIRFFMEVI